MSKSTRNAGKQWSKKEEVELGKMIKENTPTRVMGFKLGRTASAVQQKANDLGKSTKPTNQRPYNRRKKN